MKEVNCNVANDLIPLYVDDVLSEDSKMMLEKHMETCAECKAVAEKLKTSMPIAEDRDINPFKKLRKKILMRTILIVVVMLGLYGAFLFCDLTVLPVFYYGPDLMKDLQVVEMEEGLFLRRENLASRGDVVIVDDNANGEIKLYLGENIFGRFRMGWTEPLTYTQIAPDKPLFGDEPFSKVSYCDKDGKVLYVLWEKDAED
ncbi:MAG: zf-HC2 domain-containing protein [Lachnospiraceae bacterium]|nr:zf-HC2 domain-containing protein [Lachnospiraceae bacterium]